MRIALFGGSFDPPHRGHLLIADQLLGQQLADAVWFVPCADHPFHKKMSPAEQRIAMLLTMNKHTVCAYEVLKGSVSYSIETLEYLQREFPSEQFSWVMGSDQLQDFDRWHRADELVKNFQVFVYPRKGFSLLNIKEGMTLLENVPEVDDSSTEARRLIQSGASDNQLQDLLDAPVITYIQQHHLYATQP